MNEAVAVMKIKMVVCICILLSGLRCIGCYGILLKVKHKNMLLSSVEWLDNEVINAAQTKTSYY